MENDYEIGNYWNEKFRTDGHTGWSDDLVYAYDQPQRLKAIDKVLYRARISVGSGIQVLDVGCGTGDLVLEFAKRGADITGIDISSEVIDCARKRFSNFANVKLLTEKIEDADFTSNSFDLVTSVTVLQHVTEQQVFSKAIENIVRMIKENGYVIILETSPIRAKSITNRPFIIRTREEWINAFKCEGCMLSYEMGLPQLGVRLLQTYDKVLIFPLRIGRTLRVKKFISIVINKSIVRSRDGVNIEQEYYAGEAEVDGRKKISKWKIIAYKIPKVIILKIMKPFDQLLLPFPKNHTTLRIMIFKKVSLANNG